VGIGELMHRKKEQKTARTTGKTDLVDWAIAIAFCAA